MSGQSRSQLSKGVRWCDCSDLDSLTHYYTLGLELLPRLHCHSDANRRDGVHFIRARITFGIATGASPAARTLSCWAACVEVDGRY
jgi:hypothetical protein